MKHNLDQINFRDHRLLFMSGAEAPSTAEPPAPEPVPEATLEKLSKDTIEKELTDDQKTALITYFNAINENGGYRSKGYSWQNINEKFKKLIPSLAGPDDSKIRDLQSILGVEADGMIGPKTIAAFSKEILGEEITIKRAKRQDIAAVEEETATEQIETPPEEITILESLNQQFSTDIIKEELIKSKNSGKKAKQAIEELITIILLTNSDTIEDQDKIPKEFLEKINKIAIEVFDLLKKNEKTTATPQEETAPQPLSEAEEVNINILQELANELNINAKVYIDQDKTTKVKVESHNKTSVIIFTGKNYNFEEESLKADKDGYTFKQAILMADIANKAKDLDYKLSYTSAYKDFYIPGKPYNTSSKFITQEKWASLKKENIPYHWIINLLRRLGKYEN